MENMFTGMTQICHQEKVIGYARIQGKFIFQFLFLVSHFILLPELHFLLLSFSAVEISTLLDEVTVTIATSTAMSLAAVLSGGTMTLLRECL
jgi:hypothetical protein